MSYNKSFSLLNLFSLLLFLSLYSATFAKSCPTDCGGINIPFPFGIGVGCYLEEWYEIECVSRSGKFIPFLSLINKEVVEISLPNIYSDYGGSVLIRNPIISNGCSNDNKESSTILNMTGTAFYIASTNTLVGIGCNNTVSLTNVEPNMVGCRSSCGAPNHKAFENDLKNRNNCRDYGNCKKLHETNCNGNGCCKASMPDDVLQTVGFKIDDNNTTTRSCKIAFLTAYNVSSRYSQQQLHTLRHSTVRLQWLIHTTNLSFVGSLGCDMMEPSISMKKCVCEYYGSKNYGSCKCGVGYTGNPYVMDGCKDVNECRERYNGGMKICDQPDNRRKICVNSEGSYDCVYPKTLKIALG